ncbi:DUF2232 domain-containing protein [Lacibacterium aquatile]|uniref:DUF2232 domain-containing protein n=1 Tax=Lacibacterium aquatile TaxID=1168082 RepID=A0ABW5DUF5_9PROT
MGDPVKSGQGRDIVIGAALGAAAAMMAYALSLGSLGGMILYLLIPVPLFLAGFERGLKAGFAAVGVAFIASTLLLSWMMAISLSLTLFAPILALTIAALSREEGRESRMMLVLVGTAAVHFFLIWSSAPDEAEWQKNIASMMDAQVTADPNFADSVKFIYGLITRLGGLLALMVSGWLLVAGALAAGLAARSKMPALSRLWIARVDLPRWFPIVSAILLAASYVVPEDIAIIATNLLVVQGVGYVLAGLAVVHTAFWRGNIGWMGRIAFYGLVFIFGFVWLLVAVLGLVEQWAGLRKRMIASRAKADEE